jgi:hypothetical protein
MCHSLVDNFDKGSEPLEARFASTTLVSCRVSHSNVAYLPWPIQLGPFFYNIKRVVTSYGNQPTHPVYCAHDTCSV